MPTAPPGASLPRHKTTPTHAPTHQPTRRHSCISAAPPLAPRVLRHVRAAAVTECLLQAENIYTYV